MEKNWKKLYTRNSRYINKRYFFVKYRVDSGNMLIAYCITEHMLANVLLNIYKEIYLWSSVKLSWGGNT